MLDQLTKALVRHFIPLGTYDLRLAKPIVQHFFYLVHIHNSGAAWGLLSHHSFWLGILGCVVLVGVGVFHTYLLGRGSLALQVALGLICGGILGNLVDRFWLGAVVDFIDVHLPGYRWPAFNLADSAITVGAFLYAFLTLPAAKTKGH